MKFEFSAGGIVYKKDPSTGSAGSPQAGSGQEDKLWILLAKHSHHKGWVFPKGLIDHDKKETKEQAALREVKEESGADGVIEKALEPITYWYVWEKERIEKTVYYFIMKYNGGDITEHDFEMEDVRWFTPEKALETLAHKGEKDLFKKALPIIKRFANS